jgi:hypothetical protein
MSLPNRLFKNFLKNYFSADINATNIIVASMPTLLLFLPLTPPCCSTHLQAYTSFKGERNIGWGSKISFTPSKKGMNKLLEKTLCNKAK